MNSEANNPQRTRAADGDGRADASCDDARQRAESMQTADAPSTVGAATLDGVWLTLLTAAPDYCQLRYLLSLKIALPVVIALLPTLAPAPALPSFSPPSLIRRQR
jgi:hypothetical protein